LVPKGSGVSDPGGGGKKKQTAKKDETKAQKEQKKTTVKVTRQARNLKGLIFSPLAGRDAGAALAQDKRIAALTELSEDRYNTDSDMEGPRRGNGKQKGGLGAGGKGNGGWPNGSPSGVIRFIRMEYQCEGWDDGMDFSHADTNLMDEFQRRYPELKVQSKYEHHPIRLLKRYPKGNAP